MAMRRKLFFFLFLFLSPVVWLRAEVVRSEHTEAELVSEGASIQPGTPFWVALRLKMDEHWHTYWRNPGDSGIPTEIRWDLPEGFSSEEIVWPYPEKIDLPPLSVYAYENEVFLLSRITPPANLEPATMQVLRAQVYWLECEINCIPGDAALSLQLPVTSGTPKPNPLWAEAFARARARTPLTSADWQVRAEVSPSQIRFLIQASEMPAEPPGQVRFFPYEDNLIQHPAAQRFRGFGNGYELLVERSKLRKEAPEKISGILVASDGWRGRNSEKSMEINVPAEFSEGSGWGNVSESGAITFSAALMLAFAGGLILNLMPCVFPVLSLKILHFVEQARESRSRIILQGAVFTLGVLVSFWALAAALLIFRAAGHEIGWGFQLQSPAVVMLLTLLFFIFSLNLFGFFEVGLSLTSAGQKTASQSGLVSVFLNGVLATVVATPCTAPFMGSALGFAVTRPAVEAVLIFTALGAGMAAPYLLLSAFPELLRRLPRPGPWMEKLKKTLGVFLLITALWLAWVLDLQVGRRVTTSLGAGFLLLAMAAKLYGLWQSGTSRKSSSPVLLLALFLAAAGLFLPAAFLRYAGSPQTAAENSQKLNWEKFSPERLHELREKGTPVFLDFTAAWCLTCQVNERVALGAPAVRERFESLGVVLLKADWTSRDPEITRALADYGRNSVPFYVLYGRGVRSEAVILPEILTPGLVLETLKKVFAE